MKSLINKNSSKSFIVVGATAAISQLLSIGYLVFLARWIGPKTFGIHVGIFNLCSISIFFVNWGLDTWLLKKTSENQSSSTILLKKVLFIKMALGIIWSGLLLVIAPIIKPNIFLRNLLLFAILSVLFESFTNSIYTVFLTTNRFRQSSIILLIGRIVRLALLIVLNQFSIANLEIIIGTRTLVDLLILLIAGHTFGLRINNWSTGKGSLKKTFVDAIPFHASDLINIIFRQIDVTLVTFLSSSLMAISNYSLMISFFNVFSTIILSLMNVAVPSLSKERARSNFTPKKDLLRTIFIFFVLGLIGWIALSLFGQPTINLILGEQYDLASELISNSGIILLVSSINVGLAAIIIANNKQKNRIFPQITSLIVKVGASLIMFPVLQIEGLRRVYVLSEIILSVGYFFIILNVFWEQINPKTIQDELTDKLNIIFVTFNQEGKGTYLRALFLAKELVKLGHRVTILAGNIEGKKILERDDEGLKIVTFPRLFSGLFLSGWGPYELICRIYWAGQHHFDLVHAFECRPTTLIPARLLQRQGAVFFTDWADWLGKGGSVEERSKGIKKNLLRIFETYFENRRFHKSDGITAICSTLADECIKREYPYEKVLLLPNGMHNPNLKSIPIKVAREEKGFQTNSFIIGYIGAGFENDMELMYSAFRTMHEERSDLKLLHVGRSNYYTASNKAIFTTGPVSNIDISYYLSACDIFWFPLKNNSANRGRLPLKLSDYLTIGRPIISTNVGDLATWIRLLKVGLVGEDDTRSIARMTMELLCSPEQIIEMSNNALLASKDYKLGWEKRAKELEKFYYSRINLTQEAENHGKFEMQMLQ